MKKRLYTIGHSTRSLDELIDLLKTYRIEQLIDVRTVPKSRHVPQFNEDNLSQELPQRGIDYQHLEKLGGLRSTNKDSINQGWHNKSFRGYADYMQTNGFSAGIDQLITRASKKTTAIMCAEAVPWRCHRSMIGDALLIRGWEVIDIFDEKKSVDETVTGFALVDGTTITYPDDTPKDRSSTS